MAHSWMTPTNPVLFALAKNMPSVSPQSLSLEWLEPRFNMIRFPPETKLPSAILDRANVFVARTDDEVSVLCETAVGIQGDAVHGPLCGFRVVGVLDFALVGIMATLTQILADAQVSVLAVSTFNTDYVFVDMTSVDDATYALEQAGFTFVEQD